jgi:glycosyltransferase involved in cell wall biosynthesis
MKWQCRVVNTGLADARNLGLQPARAPYAFILDADNIVFPRALEQLHAGIVKDGSAAVYSMLKAAKVIWKASFPISIGTHRCWSSFPISMR